MNLADRKPILRQDDAELLGYIQQTSTSWTAQTIFGLVIARVEDEKSAEMVVRNSGLTYLQGVWQYYDASDKSWYPCVLKEVFENRVVVVRTNELGFEDAAHYKHVVIKNPTEATLLKS